MPTAIVNELNDRENISVSVKLLKEIFVKSECRTIVGRLFFFREVEIEAVELMISEIHRNLDNIMDMIKFTTGYGDFIFVTDDLKYGICIERTEYHYEFYQWGPALHNE